MSSSTALVMLPVNLEEANLIVAKQVEEIVILKAQLKAMADALAAAEARAETSENAFAVLVKYSATKRS